MDIQEKNKKLPGDYGYVSFAKKNNLKLAGIFLSICIFIYIIGVLFFDDLAPFFTIASVLLILPSAQYIAKFLSYSKYKTLDEEIFKRIDSISKDFLVLGELPIIRGKKVYNTLVTVVTKVGVFTYIEGKRDVSESRKQLLDTQHALGTILKPKNINKPVMVYDDINKMIDYLRTTVKSTAVSPDEKELGDIAKLFIIKTH